MLKRLVSIILLSFALTGCATLLKGSKEDIQLLSEPPGAEITINGFNSGKTPAKLNLTSSEEHTIVFSKEGYYDYTYTLGGKIYPGYMAVDFVLGVIPFFIDLLTEDWYLLDKEIIKVDMVKK